MEIKSVKKTDYVYPKQENVDVQMMNDNVLDKWKIVGLAGIIACGLIETVSYGFGTGYAELAGDVQINENYIYNTNTTYTGGMDENYMSNTSTKQSKSLDNDFDSNVMTIVLVIVFVMGLVLGVLVSTRKKITNSSKNNMSQDNPTDNNDENPIK